MWASGQEFEREFAFGVARQLFERAVKDMAPDDRDRLLGGAAALAGVVLEEDSPPGRQAVS